MSETEQDKQDEPSPPIINIPIEWPVPDSIQSQYASAVFVQAGPYEIAIAFFETRTLTKQAKKERSGRCFLTMHLQEQEIPKV